MTTIAHVGHTKTAADMMRIAAVIAWCRSHGVNYADKPDWIELHQGRDFLAESKPYDMVVLHFVFRGETHDMVKFAKLGTKRQRRALFVSPLASWSAWRRRLVQTGAQFIFAFGDHSCVTASYLAGLDGYTSEHFPGETVYDTFDVLKKS